jgi:hypothetical protein
LAAQAAGRKHPGGLRESRCLERRARQQTGGGRQTTCGQFPGLRGLIPAPLPHIEERARRFQRGEGKTRFRQAEDSAGATKKILEPRKQYPYLSLCPISHVPVAACQLVGIRTRGRTAARATHSFWGRTIINWQPEAKTGALRSQRGTRLKATTERAFLVSLCPPKAK